MWKTGTVLFSDTEPLKYRVHHRIRNTLACELQEGICGGIKADSTGPQCVEAGATALVAGSAVFNASDIPAAVHMFKNL